MNYDFLIVGQGITGSIVALQLKKNSKKFKLIDGHSQNNSALKSLQELSINFLKRCNLTWRGREFYEFSDSFYKEINLKAILSFINPINY